jgi:hypothetical protein
MLQNVPRERLGGMAVAIRSALPRYEGEVFYRRRRAGFRLALARFALALGRVRFAFFFALGRAAFFRFFTAARFGFRAAMLRSPIIGDGEGADG